MRKVFIAVAVVAALGVSTTVLAAPNGTNRPFKGSISGSTTAACDFDTGICDSDSEGTHISSHLGTGAYVIDSTQTWTDDAVETNGMDCAEFVTGTVTLSAANGATLVGNILNNNEAVCEVSLYEEYASNFEVVVDGAESTGKFAGASGSYWVTGTSFDPEAPSGTYEDSASMAGTISY